MSAKDKANLKFEEGMSNFLSQNYDRSIRYFSEAIAADPTYRLAFKSRGAAYLKLGKAQEAIADFNRILEIDPDNARAYHLRGLAYEKSGDHQNALKDFNDSIEQNPAYGAAYYSRATLHTIMGDTDQAAADMQMVTHLSEVNIETFANENNVWRSQQLRVESVSNDDLAMER
jgi:tetratricopeptide (TPR) repeat protein